MFAKVQLQVSKPYVENALPLVQAAGGNVAGVFEGLFVNTYTIFCPSEQTLRDAFLDVPFAANIDRIHH